MMRHPSRLRRSVVLSATAILVLVVLIPTAAAQEVTGGCHATVNGQTLDTLTRKTPLVVAKGDTVDLLGTVPASAGTGRVDSETRIYVEVVGDIPVATETGTGTVWGGSVTVPNVITQLAPGVYRVKGTAEGSGWVCHGSAYVRVEGGPVTVAAGVGAVVLGSGIAGAVRARRPKQTQVFHDAVQGSEPVSETAARLTADAVTLGLFALLVLLLGSLGPSWVL